MSDGPREDLHEEFPPDLLEDDAPAMLSSLQEIVAGVVAARLLETLAARGGTRIKTSALSSLSHKLSQALPEHAAHHALEEAERVLSWLDATHAARAPLEPADEIDLMTGADLEARRGAVALAMNASLDLELEYYDASLGSWHRLRGTPSMPDADTLELHGRIGSLKLPLSHVRWLMPVARVDTGVVFKTQNEGRVLTFPPRVVPVSED